MQRRVAGQEEEERGVQGFRHGGALRTAIRPVPNSLLWWVGIDQAFSSLLLG